MSVSISANRMPITDMWSPSVRGYISSNALWQQPNSMPGASLGATTPHQWSKIKDFLLAFSIGLDCAKDMVADDAADPPNAQIWEHAIGAMADFAGYVPVPLVLPLQLGGVSVEWHEHDIDLEILFRTDSSPYTVIDDVRAECSPFRGRDPNVIHARRALSFLAARSA